MDMDAIVAGSCRVCCESVTKVFLVDDGRLVRLVR